MVPRRRRDRHPTVRARQTIAGRPADSSVANASNGPPGWMLCHLGTSCGTAMELTVAN